MKIVLYGINFPPELTGIGKYTGEMATWLTSQGHEVRVVTAPPYYPDWKVAPEYSSRTWQQHSWQGIKVWRCPLWVPTHPGGLKRLLHLASFALTSLPVVLTQALWRPQVVWIVAPALFCAPAAWATARLCGAKAWLHIQDYEVDAAFDLGIIKGPRFKRAVKWFERRLMRRFDIVSTISHRMVDRAITKGMDIPRVKFFPNWVDVPSLSNPNPEKVARYRNQLNLPQGAVVALYSGSMGAKQGLEVLAHVARTLLAEQSEAENPVVFVFCGNGGGRDELYRQCLDSQGNVFSNVRFLDLQPAEELVHFLAAADIHLLPQRADAADLVMPSKLTGMLASARPIVATANTGTELASVADEQSGGDEVDTYGLVIVDTYGLVMQPGDAPATKSDTLTMASDPVLRRHLVANGSTYSQTLLERDALLNHFMKTSGIALQNEG